MKNAAWIWIVRVLSLCVLGPIAGALMGSLRGVDGSSYATVLISDSIMSGLLALFGVFFLAMIGGGIATKAVSLREGIFNAGLILAWGAWGAGQVGEALRGAPETGSLMKLAVEGGVVLVLSMLLLASLTKACGESGEHDDCVRFGRVHLLDVLLNGMNSVLLVLVGLAVSMFLVWLQVQTDLSGQAVWGGFIGSAAAGVIGGMVLKNHSLKHGGSKRSASASERGIMIDSWGLGVMFEAVIGAVVNKNKGRGDRDFIELSLVPVMVGVMLGGVVGPLVGMVMPGSGKILQSIAAGDMPGFLVMSSLSWAAGAMIGTPVGYSWVESSVARQQMNSATA